MRDAINDCGKALVEVWQKAFTIKHVMINLNGVKYHLNKLVKDYFTNFYKKFGKSSLHSLQRSWRAQGNNQLFDIGGYMEELTRK